MAGEILTCLPMHPNRPNLPGEEEDMTELSWIQRNGAIFSGILAFIALLTYLHVTISGIGAQVSGLRTELKDEISELRTELKDEISGLRTELKDEISGLRTEMRADLKDIRASLDRVETKVDEVRGYLRYSPNATNSDSPPVDMKK